MYKYYLLMLKDKPIYVGRTEKRLLSSRISNHRYNNRNGLQDKQFDTYKLLEESLPINGSVIRTEPT